MRPTTCTRRSRDGRHAAVPPPNSEARTAAAVAVRRRLSTAMAKSFLTCCLVAAAMMAALPASEARDTATMSAGYQHSCVVTADATVKVRGTTTENTSQSLCEKKAQAEFLAEGRKGWASGTPVCTFFSCADVSCGLLFSGVFHGVVFDQHAVGGECNLGIDAFFPGSRLQAS